jgi:hypothetical protein
MLLELQLQEKLEAVGAGQLMQPHTTLIVPMAKILGIAVTSNVYHPRND